MKERDSDLFIKLWAASTTGGQRQSSAPSKCSKRESSGFCPTAFHVLSMTAITTLLKLLEEDVTGQNRKLYR